MPGTGVTALLARARVAIEEGDSAGAQLAWDEAGRLAGQEAGARSLIQAVPQGSGGCGAGVPGASYAASSHHEPRGARWSNRDVALSAWESVPFTLACRLTCGALSPRVTVSHP